MKFEKPYLEILLFDEEEIIMESRLAKDILGQRLEGNDRQRVTVNINDVTPLSN